MMKYSYNFYIYAIWFLISDVTILMNISRTYRKYKFVSFVYFLFTVLTTVSTNETYIFYFCMMYQCTLFKDEILGLICEMMAPRYRSRFGSQYRDLVYPDNDTIISVFWGFLFPV